MIPDENRLTLPRSQVVQSWVESSIALAAFLLNAASVGWIGYAAVKSVSVVPFASNYDEQVQSFLNVMSRGAVVSFIAIWVSLTLFVLQGERNAHISALRVLLSVTSWTMIFLVSSGLVDVLGTQSGLGYLLSMWVLVPLTMFTSTRAGLSPPGVIGSEDAASLAVVTSALAATTAANAAAMNTTMMSIPPPLPPPPPCC